MHSVNSRDIVKALRLATAELHVQLDSHLPLAQASPTLTDYGRHLIVFSLWLQHIGRLIVSRPDNQYQGFLHDHSHALNLLEKDMAALKLASQLEERLEDDTIDCSTDSCPYALSLPFLVGIEYVVKGSSLGSTFLYPKVLQRFPDAPVYYMQDSALHGKARWQGYLNSLDGHDWSSTALHSAQDGAVWAFNQFIHINNIIQTNKKHREMA